MSTHTVAGLAITYAIDPIGSTGEWGAYVVQHLEGDKTTRVSLSRRKYLPVNMDKALRTWLDHEWVRTRLAENPKDRAPFFSDESLSAGLGKKGKK